MKKFEPGAKVKTGDGSVVNFEDVILSKNEAEKVLIKIRQSNPEFTVEQLVKQSLKQL